MSCDSRTDMSPGSMISISTLYRAPKWYARVMSTCAADTTVYGRSLQGESPGPHESDRMG